MSALVLSCVVEGHGELDAVGELLRRLGREIDPELTITVTRPVRVSKHRLVKRGSEFERSLELAHLNTGRRGAVLVLLDADDDCPKELGPALLKRACTALPHINASVVIANKEYEAWFLAAAESLRGVRGLRDDLTSPEEPETIRGAKEWLRARSAGKHPYAATVDQAALTARLDLRAARRAPSFDKLWREVARLAGVPAGGQ